MPGSMAAGETPEVSAGTRITGDSPPRTSRPFGLRHSKGFAGWSARGQNGDGNANSPIEQDGVGSECTARDKKNANRSSDAV